MVGQAAGQGGQKVEDVFEDITSGNSHLAGIQFVYDNDLMLGRAVGEWHPKQAVTREQLATILHRYAEWDDRRSNPYSGQPSPTLPGTRPEPPRTASTQPGGSIPQTTHHNPAYGRFCAVSAIPHIGNRRVGCVRGEGWGVGAVAHHSHNRPAQWLAAGGDSGNPVLRPHSNGLPFSYAHPHLICGTGCSAGGGVHRRSRV